MTLFSPVLLRTNVPQLATFQSHVPATAVTPDGSHWCVIIYYANSAANDWRWELWRRPPGGAWVAFDTDNVAIAEHRPGIEVDNAGNLYLFVYDFIAGTLTIRKRLAAFGYVAETVIPVSTAALGVWKFTQVYCWSLDVFVVMDAVGNWIIVDTNGTVHYRTQVFAPTALAVGQYPLLAACEVGGPMVILSAWTAESNNAPTYQPIYPAMQAMWSAVYPDLTTVIWATPDDPTRVATLPVLVDGSDFKSKYLQAPWDHIAYNQQGTQQRGSWLASVSVIPFEYFHSWYEGRDGYSLHQCYQSDTSGGYHSISHGPLKGETLAINALDGFFYRDTRDNTLYVVGTDDFQPAGQRTINVLRTTDHGVTWHDYAQSATVFTNPYAVSGIRNNVVSGAAPSIVGAFVDAITSAGDSGQNVYAFDIPL